MKNTKLTYTIFILLLFLKFQTAIAQSPTSPLDFGPALWLDATDVSSLTTSSDFVISWADKSGNGMDADALTVDKRPLYVAAENGIQFDGLTDILVSGDIGHGPDSTVTVFVIAKLDAGQEESKSSVLVKGEGGSVPYEIFYRNSKEEIQMNENSLRGKDIYNQHILGFVYEDEFTTTFYNGEWVSPAYFEFEEEEEPLTIGAKYDDADIEEYFKGMVYEVIVYQRALTTCEIDRMLGYLAHKWNLTDIMDESHPFESNEFGLCRNVEFSIPEDSPANAAVGTMQGYHLQGDQSFEFTDWRIEDAGMAGSFFELNAETGAFTVSSSAELDFEQFSSYYLYISAIANGSRIYGSVTIKLQNVDDGDLPKEHSELWGVNGEKWDPRGRLPDCSYAGYHSGEESNYSYPGTTVNVTTFGATANDATDDSGAVQDAINSLSSGGIVYFPPGEFYIDNVVQINKSNVVLRGAGQNATTLYFQNSASDILPSSSSFGNGSDGFFINFEGTFSKDDRQTIIEETRRGDKSITVADASPYVVGQLVRIFFSGNSSDTPEINPVNGGLWNHLHNDQNIDVCEGGYVTGSKSLNLYHTIEEIKGNIIVLREPLRVDILQEWGPYIESPVGMITECGIEDLTLQHEFISQPDHLDEPGYNSVHFKLAYNCWANNITIQDADNGITMNRSFNNEAKNISFTGRGGHHGVSVVASSDCLIDEITMDNSTQWHHAITMQGKAKGVVVSNISGNQVLELDFHRDAPFDCLFTNVTSAWNFESGGGPCNGAHSAARSTFWNMFAQAVYSEWDHIQTNIISDLAVPEQYHLDRGWREKIVSPEPANLHLAQYDYRINTVPELIFDSATSSTFGSRANWTERDPSRWKVEEEDGELVYELYLSELPPLSGNRPGEYSIYNESFVTDMQISAGIHTMENMILNDAADFVLIGNFQDDENYVYLQISSDISESGFYLVENGVSSLLKSINTALNSNNSFTNYTFEIEAGALYFYENDVFVESVANNTLTGGKMGIGAFDDAVAFDNITVTEAYNPLPVEWLGFSVSPIDNKYALLKWSTSSELNNDYYEVERSDNGRDWNWISKKEAAGNASIINRYEYLDQEALEGQSYYRIRQVDEDGSYSYSAIKSIFLGKEGSDNLKLHPNPAKEELFLTIENAQSNTASVQIFNALGHSVLQVANYDLQQPLSLRSLPAGLYFCQLNLGGNEVYEKKFLKQ